MNHDNHEDMDFQNISRVKTEIHKKDRTRPKTKKEKGSEIFNKIKINILSHELWHCWTGCNEILTFYA